MYNADKEEKRLYVVEYKELVFIVFIFVFILFALFPKDLIKQQILSKDIDYELSMTYLHNMLIRDPNNESLQFILAQKAMQKGDLELALSLLEKLIHSPNKKIRNQALLMDFDVLKQHYFATTKKEQKKALHKKLFLLFTTIYTRRLFDTDYEKWYKDATLVNLTPARYFFVQKIVQKDPKQVPYLRDAYALSIAMHKENDTKRYLDLLLMYDKENKNKWIETKYYVLIQEHQYKQALQLLKDAPKTKKFQIMLADLYLAQKNYIQASKIYKELFAQAQTYKEKRLFIKKILNTLLAGGYVKQAASLAASYENYFIKDKEIRTFILKIYLASGEVEKANKLSKKILYRGLTQ
jgi:thioredoxin-like negative regulator of GroEL